MMELCYSGSVGLFRWSSCVTKKMRQRYGADENNSAGIQIMGATGEYCVSKICKVHWEPTLDTFKVGGDVAGEEVRTTARLEGALQIRSDDDRTNRYWLVTIENDFFTVVGWAWGWEADMDETGKACTGWDGKPPMRTISQNRLHRNIP